MITENDVIAAAREEERRAKKRAAELAMCLQLSKALASLPNLEASSKLVLQLKRAFKTAVNNKKLTDEKQKMIATYLQSSEALANFEVSSKLLWDLGGQERYLTSHAALMPIESEYKVCVYLLVFDISKPLGDRAQSAFRPGGNLKDVPLELECIEYNRDFLRHWFTSISISHGPSQTHSSYLGKDLGVKYPAVLIAATHIDEASKMPNYKDFLESQNNELSELISDLKCEDHIVRNLENGWWFFSIDNTKSGQTDSAERCKGVEKITSILDNSSRKYWSEKNEEVPMPVAWVRFELSLVSWTEGKIISVSEAVIISFLCGIKSDKEAQLALRFLNSVGVIFYFWDVPKLAKVVIVDPKWLISTVAAFVTAKEPREGMYQREWRQLCKTGECSEDIVQAKLAEAEVDLKDYDQVLEVLRTLDILCDLPKASPSDFLIPCMLSQRQQNDFCIWENHRPSADDESFPPPIIIYPYKVQKIPQAFFFRIVTKCARTFPECDLDRSRCHFKIGNRLVLELLFYDKGTCIIVSISWDGDKNEAMSSVSKRAPEIRELIENSITDAKKRGMTGLTLEYYYQVSDCIRRKDAGDPLYQPPNDGSLVKQTNSCNPKNSDRTPAPVLYKSKRCISNKHLKLVHRWYKKEVGQIVISACIILPNKIFRMSLLLNLRIHKKVHWFC